MSVQCGDEGDLGIRELARRPKREVEMYKKDRVRHTKSGDGGEAKMGESELNVTHRTWL
jgi:hypothetical protein